MAFLKKIPSKSLLIALILHVLFFLGISTIIMVEVKQHQQPHHYQIQSYVYNGSFTPVSPPPQAIMPPSSSHQLDKVSTPPTKNHEQPRTSRFGLKKVSANTFWGFQPSVIENSRAILRDQRMQKALNHKHQADPILLIGDKNVDANPLILLMARALSKHFNYPKHEGEFGIRGKVMVELTLHPEGYFSDVEIIQSSDNEDFDASALYAVNKAPTVVGANRYLDKPKSYVVGFLFN